MKAELNDLCKAFDEYIEKKGIDGYSTIVIYSDGSGRIVDGFNEKHILEFESTDELIKELKG